MGSLAEYKYTAVRIGLSDLALLWLLKLHLLTIRRCMQRERTLLALDRVACYTQTRDPIALRSVRKIMWQPLRRSSLKCSKDASYTIAGISNSSRRRTDEEK
jgi:hypothetical protein